MLSLSGVGFNFPAKSISSFELLIFYLCLSSLNFKLIQNLAPPPFFFGFGEVFQQ